jgi:TPR repeat protein
MPPILRHTCPIGFFTRELSMRVVGFFVLLFFCGSAWAQALTQQDPNRPFSPELEAGLKAVERKHYATALRAFRPQADAGEPRAQNNLGFMFERGLGVTQSYVEAMNWYRKAADQGLPEAQFNVASFYHNGYGVEVNNSQAVFWLKKAAAQELTDALYLLGVHHLEGKGTRQDPIAAKSHFLRAARRAHVGAQFMSAYLMLSEEAGKPDLVGAHAWLLVSQMNGFSGQGLDDLLAFTTHRLKQPQLDLAAATARRCRSSSYTDCPK